MYLFQYFLYQYTSFPCKFLVHAQYNSLPTSAFCYSNCKQFEPRSCLTKPQAWSRSKLFNTDGIHGRIWKLVLKKKIGRWQTCMRKCPVGKEISLGNCKTILQVTIQDFSSIYYRLRYKQTFRAKNCIYFLTHQFKHILGAQKNHLIERIHLSTHNICFGWEIRKSLFC